MHFSSGAALVAAIVVAVLFVGPATADDIVRVRAKIDSFDGQTLNVTTADGRKLAVGVLLTTVYLYDAKKSLADIKPGDFVGTAAAPGPDGKLQAQEVHIFPEEMRGTGEGQYPMSPDSPRLMTDATVEKVVSRRGGILTLAYRGANKMADGACTGRAPLVPPPGSSAPAPPSGCTGEIEVEVAPNVPVVALMPGNPDLLVPGAEILMFVRTGSDGKKVTPGLSVEKDGFKPLI